MKRESDEERREEREGERGGEKMHCAFVDFENNIIMFDYSAPCFLF